MTDAPKKYFVRFTVEDDFDRISDFYDLNSHKNVLKREHDLMKQMTTDGAVIIVEDEKGKIVAASITYAHKAKDEHGVEHVQWQELGTTRCVLNGYGGIFDAMIGMQTLRAFLVEPPDNMFVAQMETTPVQNLAKNLGWRSLEGGPSQDLLDAKKKTVTDGHATSNDWYAIGIEALPITAQKLKNILEQPVLTNKKTGEKIELDFSKSTFVTMFTNEISHLAQKDLGNAEKPDAAQSLRARRDKWLKKFFR